MQHLSLSTSQGGVVWRPPTQRHRSGGSVPRVAAAGTPLPRRRLAAAAAQSGSSGSGSVQASSLSELQDGLQEAIKAEDYAAAARIRDRISEFMQEDPVLQAEARLDAAVREERFEVRWESCLKGNRQEALITFLIFCIYHCPCRTPPSCGTS